MDSSTTLRPLGPRVTPTTCASLSTPRCIFLRAAPSSALKWSCLAAALVVVETRARRAGKTAAPGKGRERDARGRKNHQSGSSEPEGDGRKCRSVTTTPVPGPRTRAGGARARGTSGDCSGCVDERGRTRVWGRRDAPLSLELIFEPRAAGATLRERWRRRWRALVSRWVRRGDEMSARRELTADSVRRRQPVCDRAVALGVRGSPAPPAARMRKPRPRRRYADGPSGFRFLASAASGIARRRERCDRADTAGSTRTWCA